MNEKNVTMSIRIPQEQYAEIKHKVSQQEARSAQDFINKAVRFYLAYLSADRSSDFISATLMSDFRAMIMDAEGRINRNLFRLAVEENMGHQILANQWDLSDRRWKELHNRAIREVRMTNGRISIEKTDENFEAAEEETRPED